MPKKLSDSNIKSACDNSSVTKNKNTLSVQVAIRGDIALGLSVAESRSLKLFDIVKNPAVAFRAHMNFVSDYAGIQGQGGKAFIAETGEAVFALHQTFGGSLAFDTSGFGAFNHGFSPGLKFEDT